MISCQRICLYICITNKRLILCIACSIDVFIIYWWIKDLRYKDSVNEKNDEEFDYDDSDLFIEDEKEQILKIEDRNKLKKALDEYNNNNERFHNS